MNHPSQPKVSVLVAVYRTPPEVLRETVGSVLGQTFGDFELLLQDDCPDEPREDLVREFSDPRIIYAKNGRNLGISATRNALVERARGEYLAVLDHDDVCRRDRLEKEVSWLDGHPDCGVVTSFTRHIPGNRVIERPVTDHEIRIRLMSGNALPHGALMMRASVLQASGLRYEADYSPAEDYRLMFRLMDWTSFHCIPEPLLDYREHEANTTRRQFGRMLRMSFRIMNDAHARHPELLRESVAELGPFATRWCPVPVWFRVLETLRVRWMQLRRRK